MTAPSSPGPFAPFISAVTPCGDAQHPTKPREVPVTWRSADPEEPAEPLGRITALDGRYGFQPVPFMAGLLSAETLRRIADCVDQVSEDVARADR